MQLSKTKQNKAKENDRKNRQSRVFSFYSQIIHSSERGEELMLGYKNPQKAAKHTVKAN